MTVNGPPHRAYGKAPKMKDSIQERKIIMKPSFSEIWAFLRVKMKGKIPRLKVMVKLIRSGARALSPPSMRDTPTDSNMKRALTRRATPTFLDMTLRFTFSLYL